jgi:hypothetical protein
LPCAHVFTVSGVTSGGAKSKGGLELMVLYTTPNVPAPPAELDLILIYTVPACAAVTVTQLGKDHPKVVLLKALSSVLP